MTFIVGLTGGIGSGKGAVRAAFERLGVTVIDTDAVAHQLTAPGGSATGLINPVPAIPAPGGLASATTVGRESLKPAH